MRRVRKGKSESLEGLSVERLDRADSLGNSMKIVLYSNDFLPGIGGRQIVVHHLADALLRLGHNVRVMSHGGWWSQRRLRFEYPVHRWPTSKGFMTERAWLTQLFLDTTIWGCDVIHAHNTYPTAYTAACLKRFRNIPLVVTPHGEDIHVVPEIGRGLRLDPHLKPKIGKALQRAEILTAISASVETSLLEAGGLRAKIRRIPNGVDVKRFQQTGLLDVRKRLGVAEDSRIIVTVGNYRPVKGHEVLVRSMPFILAQEPHAQLIIVGSHNEALYPLIKELNLQEKVTLPGPIGLPGVGSSGKQSFPADLRSDFLAAIYHTSDVYVSSGIGEGAEGLSLAVLEAMAAGLPVVASDISGNRDVIRNGESGFLVPPVSPVGLADAVLRVLSNSELQQVMRGRALAVAKQYEWTPIALQYLAVYDEARELSGSRALRKH